MHLRRLDVQGFKAFAERQTFEFGTGITVVVGPNGSGKSNIHDAIRWALGEQAGRQIRARKTEDVIFSGSDQRRQLGTAEVTITLDNSEGWMPIDYREVSVTRRAHRSGENEYLINGQRVRLTDVHDLLRRARVGQNSYAMMSQGLVDEVLAMRPQERRGLIEEAADVRGHRQQLQLSERRLTETRDNLGHVRLLIREVEPRLRQLERQSKRAERHRELQRQLHEALRAYYEQELRSAQEALVAARARHDQETRAFTGTETSLKAHDERLATLELTVAERRTALDTLQTEERGLAEEGLRLEQQVALTEQRLELLTRRIDDIDGELASGGHSTDRPAGVGADGADEPGGAAGPTGESGPAAPADPDERLAALELTVEQARGELDREEREMQGADGRARAALRQIAETEARRTRLEAERADAARRIEDYERRRSEIGALRTVALARRDELLGELKELGRRALDLKNRDGALTAAIEGARQRRSAAEAELESQLGALTEARDAVRGADAQVRQLIERRELLTQLSEQAGASRGGSQALLDAARAPKEDREPLSGVVGAVSRLITVPEGLEHAIEAALAERFLAVVVEREDDAIAAIEYLREQSAGTATVLPLESIEHNYPLNLFNERGVIGVAARLVRTEKPYRALVDTLLGRTIVVDDLDTARQMVKRGLGSVVTRDGIMLRPDGAYYGGRGEGAAQQFTLQGELESLPEQIAEAERSAAAMGERLRAAEQTLSESHAAVGRARGGVDETNELQRSHDQQAGELGTRRAALAGEMGVVHGTLAAVADGSALEAATAAEHEAERGIEQVEGALAALRDRSNAVVDERDAAAERVTAAVYTLAAAEGASRAAREAREQQAEAAARALKRAEHLRRERESARTEIQDLELSLRGHREQAANNRSAATLAQQAIGPAHAALAEATEQSRELAASRGELQGRLLTAERATLQADSDLRERAAYLETLNRQLAEEGLEQANDGTVQPVPAADSGLSEDSPADEDGSGEGIVQPVFGPMPAPSSEPVSDTVSDAVGAPMRGAAEVEPELLRDRISELRGEIRALGAVNVDALEDLSEERERHEYLSGQVEDLEAAERELRVAIRDLRKLIRERFDQTFAEVNVAFSEYFSRFFGGGTAALTLVEPPRDEDDEVDEDSDPGIDITAQPPGKRIASLNVLSGGERALTSVALLFALLSVNPAPVCVLDEVDAALDEANVGRFIDTLRELCERSQFIVVSHNRRTIEAADAIYGVSMGEDSVSRVLSLKLADLPQAS
jgi:chromosome segregation protein